ncbi:hypothetical protein C8Q69DRAFT_83781 [Paecilomyces variotii]|uniref:F-box domain-containing protein n=1 Tax=Byssochlamys spectabilis TaxID=264951 RepID=A0A443HLC7_BYSSP|nr:hypothetical protein C8Q69DRAFT_83781 [Paecilomyces variotii]RWQ92608.1 hypothetical protein C8Q69DRAFT_83781 [Paecilomyces variotii]
MGNKLSYCEPRCQICAVAFRVNRIPTPQEREAQMLGNEGAGDAHDGILHSPGAGYDGSLISADEMKGVDNLRCLLRKPDDFTPEDGDEDFEKDATCFLTDVAAHRGPVIYRSGPFRTSRHGVTEAKITNDNDAFGGEWGMPFHPTCFEIFKRVCLAKLGYVDIDGLWRVRDLRGSYEYSAAGTRRALSVRQYAFEDEGWHYKPGTEYLAANPVNIPGFEELVKSCADEPTVEGNGQLSPESSPQQDPEVESPKPDIFSKLPNELLSEIMWYLSPGDIANLRLATRSYRCLPDILFKHLIRTEMPYFWEFDDLDSQQTDWSQLYAKLKLDWKKNVLGLRNRERIWKEVEGIVKMISETNCGLVH